MCPCERNSGPELGKIIATETRGTGQAFGLRLPLLNVAFWRNQLQIAAFKPPKRQLRHTETTDQACCLCLTSLSEPTRSQLQIAAFKPPKHWLRHAEAPCHWGTDQAFGLRLPLLNVAFWTDKERRTSCKNKQRKRVRKKVGCKSRKQASKQKQEATEKSRNAR